MPGKAKNRTVTPVPTPHDAQFELLGSSTPAPSPSAPLVITEDVVRAHIGKPSFLNWTETHFSCVDGRYRASMIATAGGDAAEFLLALNVANKLGV